MINYKEYESSYLEQVAALLKQLGYNVSSNDLADRINRISNNNGNVFIAIDSDDKVIGCVHALLDTRLAGGTFGEIVSLVVDESVRGKGIGKGLIQVAEKYLKEKGLSRLRVRCNIIRDDAHEFYKHLEFAEKKSQKIFEKPI